MKSQVCIQWVKNLVSYSMNLHEKERGGSNLLVPVRVEVSPKEKGASS